MSNICITMHATYQTPIIDYQYIFLLQIIDKLSLWILSLKEV